MLVGVKLEVAATVLSALLASVCAGGAPLKSLRIPLSVDNDGLGNRYYIPSSESDNVTEMHL